MRLPLATGHVGAHRSQGPQPGAQGGEVRADGRRAAAPSCSPSSTRVFARNMRDLGTPVYARRFFEEVLRGVSRSRAHHRRAAEGRAGRGRASRIGRATMVEIPWASSIRDYNTLCPNHLLYWHAIETAVAEGCDVFDFGRSTPDEGTYKFKEQWGAAPGPAALGVPAARGGSAAGPESEESEVPAGDRDVEAAATVAGECRRAAHRAVDSLARRVDGRRFSAFRPSTTTAPPRSSSTARSSPPRRKSASPARSTIPAFRRTPSPTACARPANRADDLDYVAFYEKPLRKFERLLETYLAFAPRGLPQLPHGDAGLAEGEAAPADASSARASAPASKAPLVFTDHHESHAASAFFPSPFDEAAILTLDGVGEWSTTTLGVGRGNRIELTQHLQFPHSLGPALLRVHLLLRLQGQQRRVQADGPGALRPARSTRT